MANTGTQPCSDGTSTCGPDLVTLTSIKRSLDESNEVFRAAGVRFSLAGVEKYKMPNYYSGIADASADHVQDWDDVKDELRKPFPSCTPPSAYTSIPKIRSRWVYGAASFCGKKNEIYIMMASAFYGIGDGASPWKEKSVVYQAGLIDLPYHVAHEFGHYFGLNHTFAHDNVGYDPITGNPGVNADYWDLMYNPNASAPQFFNSRAEALDAGTGITSIDRDGNCSLTSDDAGVRHGVIKCNVTNDGGPDGGQPYFSDDGGALKGVGLVTGNLDNPDGGSYRYARNLMSDLAPNIVPNSISSTQAEQVRKYLRYNLNHRGDDYVGTSLSADRNLLGSLRYHHPVYSVYFDGDDKRDIVLWLPPRTGTKHEESGTGTFRVLLSTQSYSTSASASLTISMGKVGDMPVLGDFNNDGRTDVAVVQPGGGASGSDSLDANLRWSWCLTNVTNPLTGCSAPTTPATFGLRGDIPLSDARFGSNSSVAVYRPSTGRIYWTTSSSLSSWTTLPPDGPIGGEGQIPLLGLYDNDTMTDIAFYDPQTAIFRLVGSQSSWQVASQVSTAFDSKYVGQGNATTQDGRAAAIPMAGMSRVYRNYYWAYGRYTARDSFALWFPSDGKWIIQWDPIGASSIVECQWGQNGDVPISHLDTPPDSATAPSSSDYYSQMAVFRPGTATANSVLYLREHTGTGCGASSSVTFTDSHLNSPRTMSFATDDMGTDGKPELWLVDPLTMVIKVYDSSSGYSSLLTTISYNDTLAEVL